MASILGRGRGRGPALDEAGRAALERVLANPTFELIPLKNADDEAGFLPSGATVSVTASPAKGLMATVDLALRLNDRGFHVIPHLSARLTRDRAELLAFLTPLRDAGIDRLFVVGGDPEEPGDYPDGLAILREMADLNVLPAEVGIPCYPAGHASIADEALEAALAAKAPFAAYMTTQLCFDPARIRRWIDAKRAAGIDLPIKLGTPGVAAIPKLIEISARIGVRDASRFILKNTAFVGQLLTSGGIYRPTAFLRGVAPVLADPVANVIDLHVYTFNQVEATESWRRDMLAP
ncbi:MAG TPA: methylenetetrahydrofolate reductase [Candidatus Limnocylindrales bacterium]|nr:methylenetetrahydrofolate reductase [Candidatus Limnocylindrales bacterium]